MIGRTLQRLVGTDTPTAEEVDDLRAEVARLRAQNEKLKRAMRHCIDCEYRIEVVTRRAADGLSAAGEPMPDDAR